MIKASTISDAARILREGGLVAMPTETVYGLAADATNDQAVARIFAVKGRPRFNPLISHVATAEAAFRLGAFSTEAKTLADAFWPGPLTLVVERQPACPISLLCSAGLSTVALRVPSHPLALELLTTVDRPLAAPSANTFGCISPTTAEHVRVSLGHVIDMIIDGGPCRVGLESTVVRCTDHGPLLLRHGGIARAALEEALGRKMLPPTGFDDGRHSPGQLASHYAPRARLRLDATAPKAGEVYLGFGDYAAGPHTLSDTGNLQEAAANLFRLLHELDRTSPKVIAVAPIPLKGLGEAINDRLQRAAAGRPIA